MSLEFGTILQGLMDNRRLSVRAVSRASGLAESTIKQLVDGRIVPTYQILEDIAPALQLSVADLLVIAGVAGERAPDRQAWYEAAEEIGELIAVATLLTPDQVQLLLDDARGLHEQNER
jgi:transcriptional regulator with XRE-family HTH domain